MAARTNRRSPRRPRRPLHSLLTAARWHRRLLAAGLAAAAVAAGLAAAAPPAAPAEPIVVAAHDLPAGQVPAVHDLRVVTAPPRLVPAHTFTTPTEVPARALLGPVRAGIPITDVDFVDAYLLGALGPNLVATPVRIADAAALGYVRVGDRVDIIAAATVTGDGGAVGTTQTIASAVPVLAVANAEEAASGNGGLIVVAASAATARTIAGAAITSRLSLALRSATDTDDAN